MKIDQLLEDVRDANLSYMMLAKQMIQTDKAEATFRLGITDELATLIASLTMGQLIKIASSNMLVCRFRFDDRQIWDLVASHSKDGELGKLHAAILIGNQALETI